MRRSRIVSLRGSPEPHYTGWDEGRVFPVLPNSPFARIIKTKSPVHIADDVIAIVIIGGTSLFGGSGAVWRTAIGLLLLAVLTNVFDALALDSNFPSLSKGVIVIGAVALDAFSRRR